MEGAASLCTAFSWALSSISCLMLITILILNDVIGLAGYDMGRAWHLLGSREERGDFVNLQAGIFRLYGGSQFLRCDPRPRLLGGRGVRSEFKG